MTYRWPSGAQWIPSLYGKGEDSNWGPIIYLFDGRSLSRHKQRSEFLHLAGALMEHFHEGIILSLHSTHGISKLARLHFKQVCTSFNQARSV